MDIQEDLLLTARFAINTYDVVFRDHLADPFKTETVEHGKNVVAPQNPTRVGYTFAGWYADPNVLTPFDFTMKINNPTTIYAKWTPILVVDPVLPVLPVLPDLPDPLPSVPETPPTPPDPIQNSGPTVYAPENFQVNIVDGKIRIYVKEEKTAEWKLARLDQSQISGKTLILQFGQNGDVIDTKGFELPKNIDQLVVLENDQAYTYVDLVPKTDPKKIWKVHFSAALLNTRENLNHMTVQDAFGKPIQTSVMLSKDKKTVIITPSEPYKKGQLYVLTVSNVVSEKGKQQKEPVRKLFIVE